MAEHGQEVDLRAIAAEIIADLAEGREPVQEKTELLRQATNALSEKEKRRLRSELGIAALRGSATVVINGRNLGVDMMRVRFGERDARVLRCMMKLAGAMKVVYRDYDFKAITHLLARWITWRNAGNLNSLPEEEAAELRSTERELYGLASHIARTSGVEADLQLRLLWDTDNAFQINDEFTEQRFLQAMPEDLVMLRGEFQQTWAQVRGLPFSRALEGARTMFLLLEEIRETVAMLGRQPELPALGETLAQVGGRIIAAKRMIDDEVDKPTVVVQIEKFLEEAKALGGKGDTR